MGIGGEAALQEDTQYYKVDVGSGNNYLNFLMTNFSKSTNVDIYFGQSSGDPSSAVIQKMAFE